jgi:hypothetical protein
VKEPLMVNPIFFILNCTVDRASTAWYWAGAHFRVNEASTNSAIFFMTILLIRNIYCAGIIDFSLSAARAISVIARL